MKKRSLRARVRRNDRRFAVFWLLQYRDMKKALDAARDTSATVYESYIHSRNKVSDPTGKRAAHILTDPELARFRKAVQIIDDGLRLLPPHGQEIIRKVYLDAELTDGGMIQQLHYEPRQYYRIKALALDVIAQQLVNNV